MKRFRIVVTTPARGHIDEIIDFVTQDWPDYADRLLNQLETAIDSLDHLPHRFVRVGFTRRRKSPVHRMVVGDYLIYYRIETDTVHVMMVRHGARKPPKGFN